MTDWEKIHQSRHWGTYPEIYMVRQVKAFMAARAAGGIYHALDIGCGAGSHSWMMDDEGLTVTGIDLSPTAIGHLGKMIRDQNRLDMKGHVADICSVALPPETFDFILDNLSLTHVEHPPIDRIKSWLRPGGWFVSAQFEFPPKGAPPSWQHDVGEHIERHQRIVGGEVHGISLQRHVRP